jgi:Protein of unknown function (DUF2808)
MKRRYRCLRSLSLRSLSLGTRSLEAFSLGLLSLTVALAIGTLQPVLSQGAGSVSPTPDSSTPDSSTPVSPDSSPDRGFFLSSPRLVGAEATFNRILSPNAIYFFTLSVPAEAGSGLQRIEIAQRESSSQLRRIQYRTDDTTAFVGTPEDRGVELTIAETSFDRDSQTLSVRFDPPVPPGTTVTLRLRPRRNPRLSGVYLFGVTAYPTGPADRGQFLGYGRLHFYENDSRPFL